METKRCKKCNEDLGLDSFYNIKNYKGGKDKVCKRCRVEKQMEYNKTNYDKLHLYRKEWSRTLRERLKKKAKRLKKEKEII